MSERLREHLLQEIQRNRWLDTLPSERLLSRELRVSRPTLREALRSLAAEGIVEPRRRHPYRIVQGAVAGRSRRQRSPEVLFLYNSRARPNLAYFAPFVAELQQRLHPLGFGVHMINVMQGGAKGINRALARIDQEFYPAYYLLVSVPSCVHAWFALQQVPSIILGSCDAAIRLPSVEVDQEATVQHAISYLVRRRHRRISLLQVPVSSVGDSLAAEAFQRACLSFKPHGVVGSIHTAVPRPALVERSVRQLLSTPQRPTAVVVTDLELALGLYTTLGELGLGIPRDVSVIITCQSPSFDFVRPFPTCYQFSMDTLADRITKLIEQHCRLGTWPRARWKMLPKLREGASVATL